MALSKSDKDLGQVVYEEEYELEEISNIKKVLKGSIQHTDDGIKFDTTQVIAGLKKIRTLSENEKRAAEKSIKSIKTDIIGSNGSNELHIRSSAHLEIEGEIERVSNIIMQTILKIRDMEKQEALEKQILEELHNCMVLKKEDEKISFVLQPSIKLMKMLGIKKQSENMDLNIEEYFAQQGKESIPIQATLRIIEHTYNRHLQTELTKKPGLINELHIGTLDYLITEQEENLETNRKISATEDLRKKIKAEIEKDPHWITQILDMIRSALGIGQYHTNNVIKHWVKEVAKEVNKPKQTRG